MPHDLLNKPADVGRHHKLVVIRVQSLGHSPGIGQFVIAGLAETDGKRLYRPPHFARHRRHHRAGVDPARKEGAQRHIAFQSQADRLGDQFAEPFDVVAFLALRLLCRLPGVVKIPIAPRLNAPVSESHEMAGGQSGNAFERRGRVGHIAKGKKIRDGFRIDFPANRGMLQQRFDFRAKDQSIAHKNIVQRLLANPVASQEELVFALIPNGHGEHAAQPLHRALTFLLIEVDDDFSVTTTPKTVPALDQFLAELPVVIDLSVEYNPNRAVLV